MRVELLQPDSAPQTSSSTPDAAGFAAAVDAIGAVLNGATAAEDAYAKGSGSLQDAQYRRAQADITLAVAAAAVQRAAQAVQTVLNLSV